MDTPLILFEESPLAEENEIRLVQIVPQETCPQYESLSYT